MKIKAAHDLLASEEVGFLSGYEVNGDTIKAHINHTGGQLAHIAKKATGKGKAPRKQTTV